MSSTTFVNQQTVIQADWLNDVNSVTYNLIGDGTTIPASKPALLTSIGALGSANNLSDIGNAATARTNLGVTASGADTTYLFRANNLSDLTNAATARTNLGLGSIATQAASNVAITGGSITGITDLAVADGGTGASSITANSVILGNGTSTLSGNLVAPGTSGNVLTSNGTTWQSTTPVVYGMTLLGTITVATSPVLSSLTLTSYKQLYIVLNGVSSSSGTGNLTLLDPNSTSINLCPMPGTSTNGLAGIVLIDLATGVINSNINDSATTTLPTYKTSGVLGAGKTTFSTSTTSLTFGVTTGAFDLGTILVYGVK